MSDKKFQEMRDKRNVLENDLRDLEQQIYDLETKYLEETAFTGNIISGWGGYLTMKNSKVNPGVPRKSKVNPSDRVFSQSSKTSPFYQVESQIEEEGKPQPDRSRRIKKKKNYATTNYKKEQENNDNTPASSSEEYQDNVMKKNKGSKKF